MQKLLSKNEKETFDIAKKIATKAKDGDIFCLVGELGVGKTHFVKGFAHGLGVNDNIDSPTFTIVKEYVIPNSSSKKLFHFDVYRLDNAQQLDDIGFDEYIYSKNISIIEWADLIKEKIPQKAIWIHIVNNDNTREISITP